nr:hypothetical protein BCU58_24290 [Vibrio sp. 10N.286.48.B7]
MKDYVYGIEGIRKAAYLKEYFWLLFDRNNKTTTAGKDHASTSGVWHYVLRALRSLLMRGLQAQTTLCFQTTVSVFKNRMSQALLVNY